VSKAKDQPNLTFFCELEPEILQDLFSKSEVIEHLKLLNAHVSLGLLDLSQERANVVRLLNREGIQVTAWLLLPKEEGYWFNLENAPLAINQYAAFKLWSGDNDLRWSKIGLDIEPDIQLIQEIARNRQAGLKKLLLKYFRNSRVQKAIRDYQMLVTQIRSDGYFVESYQIPLIVDERKARSSVLQRLAGLVDLNVDREVLMLYTSFLRPYGAGFLWSYAPKAGGVGVGNTGGGVKMEGVKEPDYLNWSELQRDLLLAKQLTREIYIFSLEGCFQHGFLEKLINFAWNQKQALPIGEIRKVNLFRRIAQPVLWSLSHPGLILATGLGLFLLIRRIKK
jgi:hypothetical protein